MRLPTLPPSLPALTGAPLRACLVAAVLAATPSSPLFAQTSGNTDSSKNESEQVIVPQVERRDVRLPRFPSNDFEFGLLGGLYAAQNFGSSGLYGMRLAYHITEDFFFEAAVARTKVSDETFRRVLPGGIFTKSRETLQTYNFSAGVNLLPGEVFIGRNRALPVQLFALGGVGATSFNHQRQQTFHLGVGTKVFVRDWLALRLDMQTYHFPLDLLGKRETTRNLSLSTGVSVLF